MNAPSAELREAVGVVEGALHVETFYSECGTKAIAHYQDEDRDYFITLLQIGRNPIHTASLDVPRESPEHGWQTGWEC